MNRRQFLASACGAGFSLRRASARSSEPRIRALTAFINLDRPRWQQQIREALTFLRSARDRLASATQFEIQSIRIVTQPFPQFIAGLSRPDSLRWLKDLDSLAAKEQFDPCIGPAMLRSGDDAAMAGLLTEVLCTTRLLNSSLITGGEGGVYRDSIRAAARLIYRTGQDSPGGLGNFNFAASTMLGPLAPFYPAAWHNNSPRTFAIGCESANLVEGVFDETAGDPSRATLRLTQALTTPLKLIEKTALDLERDLRWSFAGIDPTPAPLKDVSIGAAIEKFTGNKFGAPGTLTACAAITRAVQAVPVRRTGYAGLMVPVLEDSRLAQRWAEGAYNMTALLSYSAVCATGLDTVPLPGDTSEQTIARILEDVASLAVKWSKPLCARLLPVKGKGPGERTAFDDPFLVNTTLKAIE